MVGFGKESVTKRYIEMIQDIYSRAMTTVRTVVGETNSFPITVGLHQGSALSPYLFALVMDELTRHMQDKDPDACLLLIIFFQWLKLKLR